MGRSRFQSGFHYTTESLGSYTRRVHRDTENLGPDMARHMGRRLEFWIRRLTPVDTERLRKSIRLKPFLRFGPTHKTPHLYSPTERTFIAEVETDNPYAPFVEYDTGKYGPNGEYVIRPVTKKALAFVGRRDGKLIIVTHVLHPGSKGRHMFTRGAARLTPTYIRNQTKPILSKWRLRHLVARPR